MDPSSLTLQLLIGLSSGLVTFLMAAGVSLVISGMNIVNFGQGAFFMLGAFLCYALLHIVGFWWALLLGALGVAILGGLCEFILRSVYGKNMMYQMLITMGIAFVIIDSMSGIWGRDIKIVTTPAFLSSTISVFNLSFPTYRIFIMVVAGIFALGLWLMFEKTKLGMTFRAIISDRTMVGNLGINVTLLFSIMFMVGVGLSGIAGVIMAPIMGIEAQSSMNVLFSVMTVLIIGGLTDMRGALFASLIVGVINAFGSLFVPSLYALIPGFLMIIVLIIKPRGLFAARV